MSQVIDGTGLTADDLLAIRGTFEAWRDACVRSDWDALLGMCTDDIVFLPPGESTVEGAGEIHGSISQATQWPLALRTGHVELK